MEMFNVRTLWSESRDRVRVEVFLEDGCLVASREFTAEEYAKNPQNVPEALDEWSEIKSLGRPKNEIQYAFS